MADDPTLSPGARGLRLCLAGADPPGSRCFPAPFLERGCADWPDFACGCGDCAASAAAGASRVPAPSGPYRVGTITMQLVDPRVKRSTPEGRTSRAGSRSRSGIQPCPESNTRPAPWMEDATIVAPAIAEWLDLPRFFLDHLALATSSSYAGAPVDRSGSPFPVLIFLARVGWVPGAEHLPDAGAGQPWVRGRGHGAHLRCGGDGLSGWAGRPRTIRRPCQTASPIPSTRRQRAGWWRSGSATWPSLSAHSRMESGRS